MTLFFSGNMDIYLQGNSALISQDGTTATVGGHSDFIVIDRRDYDFLYGETLLQKFQNQAFVSIDVDGELDSDDACCKIKVCIDASTGPSANTLYMGNVPTVDGVPVLPYLFWEGRPSSSTTTCFVSLISESLSVIND